MAKFLIVWSRTNTPLKIRESGMVRDPILYWCSKQSASEFLTKGGHPIDEFEIVEISDIGEEAIAKMLFTTRDELTYREHVAR